MTREERYEDAVSKYTIDTLGGAVPEFLVAVWLRNNEDLLVSSLGVVIYAKLKDVVFNQLDDASGDILFVRKQ